MRKASPALARIDFRRAQLRVAAVASGRSFGALLREFHAIKSSVVCAFEEGQVVMTPALWTRLVEKRAALGRALTCEETLEVADAGAEA